MDVMRVPEGLGITVCRISKQLGRVYRTWWSPL